MNEIGLAKIESMIYIIRDQKVLLDSYLAELYGIETKALKRAVRRNINRFPSDFMFEMSEEELKNWYFKFATFRYCSVRQTRFGTSSFSN